MNNWFIPEPEEFPSQRALLHFGLNKAVRYYRELVVPGIGGVWFVRQLSWAVAGIKLAENSDYIPAKIANGIEALAGKLEWKNNEEFSGKGKRAFEREPDVWDFKRLSTKNYYVQSTYRMATVRALTGLGFATGTRFNSMELTEAGNELAEIFLGQKCVGKLKNDIGNWLEKGKKIPKSGKIVECLCKENVSPKEKQIALNRLLAGGNGCSRELLRTAFGRNTVNMPEINTIKKNLGQKKQKKYLQDIETAMAFDAMLECGRQIIYQYAEFLAGDKNGKELPDEKLDDLRKKMEEFDNSKGEKHTDARDFANMKESAKNITLLNNLVQRDGNILMLQSNNNRIVQGSLFDHRKDIAEDNDNTTEEQGGQEDSSTKDKIRQFFTLWRDSK